MSYIVLSDRVKEITRTSGSTSLELEGAATGFSSFGSRYSHNDVVFYAVTDGTEYEIGSGVYATGTPNNSLSRFPLRSSNSDNLVSFSTGIKEVYVTYPATHAVYHGSGLGDLQAPEEGGICFWITDNMVGYDNNVVWDSGHVRLGIRKPLPDYTLDVGGDGPQSAIQASGFLVGTSGVYFPQANNGDVGYPGGRQLIHFEKNQVLDADVALSIGYSGDVNQFIYLKDQAKGFVLAGPPSGCEGSCSPATPFFRPLTLEDIPNLDALYATDGQLEEVSGVLENTIFVSGISYLSTLASASGALNNTIIASGEQFLSDLSSASGALDSKIDGVSGVLRNDLIIVSGLSVSDSDVSGILRNDLTFVSGLASFDLDVSGILRNDLTFLSGVIDNNSDNINLVSGIIISSGTQFVSDLEAASGELDGRIVAVSGMVISSGTQFLLDLDAASGDLFSQIEASSGISDRLLVDLTGTTNTAVITNDDVGEPTHFRITNNNGIGSRLLLTSASGEDGNTWANVSLNDGAYRVYNYTYDWNIEVSGLLLGSNQIILNSGTAWRELLPIALSGVSVSGTFLNNAHPSGVRIVWQSPPSGHILTIEAHPGQSLITNTSPSLPEEVKIFSVGVNSIVATKENKFGLNLDPQAVTSDLDIRGESIRIRNSGVITSPTDPGYKGEIKWDENYIYVCVANNTWKRSSLATWTATTTTTTTTSPP